MENYRSDYEAPLHTVLGQETDGINIITRVIMDGEVVEFVASRQLVMEGRQLGTNTAEQEGQEEVA
jgi:hypothetical protein